MLSLEPPPCWAPALELLGCSSQTLQGPRGGTDAAGAEQRATPVLAGDELPPVPSTAGGAGRSVRKEQHDFAFQGDADETQVSRERPLLWPALLVLLSHQAAALIRNEASGPSPTAVVSRRGAEPGMAVPSSPWAMNPLSRGCSPYPGGDPPIVSAQQTCGPRGRAVPAASLGDWQLRRSRRR